MGSFWGLFSRKFVFFFRVLWVSAFTTLFGVFNHWLFRFWDSYIYRKRSSNSQALEPTDYSSESYSIKGKMESKNGVFDSNGSNFSGFDEKEGAKISSLDSKGSNEGEEPKSFLQFRFPTYEEFISTVENDEHPLNDEAHQIKHCDDHENSQEHSEVSNPDVDKGSYKESNDNSLHNVHRIVSDEILAKEDELQIDSEVLVSNCDANENFVVDHCEKEDGLMSDLRNDKEGMKKLEVVVEEDESIVSSYSDSESIFSSSKFSLRSSFIDSISDGFLSDSDFENEFDTKQVEFDEAAMSKEDIELQNLNKGYETDDFDDEDEDILNELKNIEVHVENEQNGTLRTNQNPKEMSGSNPEDANELESLWEHQDLVDQLKMEIKKVRAIGLPTILEESESPKIMDGLKPWKIDEKFQNEGTIGELHKFYESYRERMRKFDILNYQKKYALDFLRRKNSIQSTNMKISATPMISTIISLDCWPCKPKSSEVQKRMVRFSRDLESDLEMIYVGQMCLSWEFLSWEYAKALELWDSDPHSVRSYNEVAEEFQQFQVLLHRFVEDEPFQGPRVQHYVRNRCALRNLLQVPVIREDNRKKEKRMGRAKDAITSSMLVEIVEESIRVFWQFVRKDKEAQDGNSRCRRGPNVVLQNPADNKLLMEVQSTLQKKEKKLKDLVKSEKCILRKFQKHHEEDNSDHVLYFFSQVDMKLVWRVLNMSRVTSDQLIWCTEKLSKINFLGKKIRVEPSFLLFPCS